MQSEKAMEFLNAQLGQAYVSDWITVDQDLIGRFADTTQDWNFIHIDQEKAAETELGGTIAHGFLVTSLLAPLRNGIDRPSLPYSRFGLNYGFDRLRFVSPVRSGSRVRGHFTVTQVTLEEESKIREVMDVRVEIEGSERPAIVASWLTMYLL